MTQAKTSVTIERDGNLRTYRLTTKAKLRDNYPADKQRVIIEQAGYPTIRTGNVLFDALYAMAVAEAEENSVSEISDEAYGEGKAIKLDAFQTGELWKYVWTRDLSYSLHLALANFDPTRAVSSLLFKSSGLKADATDGAHQQIIQDTGSGGSYPVSTDRVIWALGAHETLKNLTGTKREDFLRTIYPILRATAEQDRQLIFDPKDGLYRGEQSFLDWREQTYPTWTRENVVEIANSKALSTNAAHYFLLKILADYGQLLAKPEEARGYAEWATDLKEAINKRFYDEHAGFYVSYLLSDGANHYIPAARYDLLGLSLVILFGIADDRRARKIIDSYPVGKFGPPVVHPQEQSVPIYHNQGIWPFVTAYWIKAAAKAKHGPAVTHGITTMEQLAATNLSNMENFDLLTGAADVKTGPRRGPVVNSRRQLWSVAGYLSVVQDVVFGFESTLAGGIRFRPFLTAALRTQTFALADTLELRDFTYCGTRHLVRVHLPPAQRAGRGIFPIERLELNGKLMTDDFIGLERLDPTNTWEITLGAPEAAPRSNDSLAFLHLDDERAVFAPAAPGWAEAKALEPDNGRLQLRYRHENPDEVSFNIYRDGKLAASQVHGLTWIDPASFDYRNVIRTYAVEAVDRGTGNVSHRTPGKSYRAAEQYLEFPASQLRIRGTESIADDYFERWGKPGDEVTTKPFQVERSGTYLVRTRFANGAGPVSTGIACAVKKLEVRQAAVEEVIATGYVVMPQSGDWNRYDLSAGVPVRLLAGEAYVLRFFEDEYCRNMSYFARNESYTAAGGGGADSFNRVNLSAFHLEFVAS